MTPTTQKIKNKITQTTNTKLAQTTKNENPHNKKLTLNQPAHTSTPRRRGWSTNYFCYSASHRLKLSSPISFLLSTSLISLISLLNSLTFLNPWFLSLSDDLTLMSKLTSTDTEHISCNVVTYNACIVTYLVQPKLDTSIKNPCQTHLS